MPKVFAKITTDSWFIHFQKGYEEYSVPSQWDIYEKAILITTSRTWGGNVVEAKALDYNNNNHSRSNPPKCALIS